MFQGLNASFWCVTGSLICEAHAYVRRLCLGLAFLRMPSLGSAHIGCGLNSFSASLVSMQVPLRGHMQAHAPFQGTGSLLNLDGSSRQQTCIAWNHAGVDGQGLNKNVGARVCSGDKKS